MKTTTYIAPACRRFPLASGFSMLSLCLLLLAVPVFSRAQTGEQEVSSKIEEATVFRQGAEVHRYGEARLSAGRHTLKFSGLSANLHPESIQFSATGAFTILSVNHQVNYLEAPRPGQKIESLEARRKQFVQDMKREQALLQAFDEEEGLLLANKQIGGQQNGVSIDALQAAADYFRSRLREVKLEKLAINQRIESLQDTIGRLQQQLQQLNARPERKAISEVLVTLDAPRSSQASFHLSYLVTQAGWAPLYNLRVEAVGQPIQLDYKAKVMQQSGEDWSQVNLTLSTGNPMQYSRRPDLMPWWLSIPTNTLTAGQYPIQSRGLRKGQAEAEEEAYLDEVQVQSYDMPAQSPSVTVADQATTFTFQIDAPYDVPSDGQQYVVQIGEESLPASYVYYCAPKLNPAAFLSARVADWEDYRLLSGEANLFFEGTYLGRSSLNVNDPSDTLTFSLGQDDGVVVSRSRDKQFTDKQFIGNKKTKEIGWAIEVRNSKRQSIDIVIEDQYPISTSDEIEVELGAHRGATVDKDSGKLRWELQLEPGKTEKLSFRYSVKYPKKMNLNLE